MRKRLRLALLLAALLASLLAYGYDRLDRVRVESVPFESRLVGAALPYGVVLPRGYYLPTRRSTRYPVLYLLHGWGGDHSSWLKHTRLTEYAADHGFIVVTPEGRDHWYTDGEGSPSDRFESYVVEELMPDVERRYRAIAVRGGRAVAGLSMGGYGALKFGLKHPDKFAFAASTGGAFDAASRDDDASIKRTFGPPGSPTRAANDIFKLAREFPEARTHALPYIYVDCGSRDPWLASNRALNDLLLERRFTHEFRLSPGGHDWFFWDRRLGEIMRAAEEVTLAPQP